MRIIHATSKLGFAMLAMAATAAWGQTDPGVRKASGAEGSPLPGLTTNELKMFRTGPATFNETERVSNGLGPRYNLDSCGGLPSSAPGAPPPCTF